MVYFRKHLGRLFWISVTFLFVPLIPVLNFRELSEEHLIFDRYLYLSVAGWALLISLALESLSNFEAGSKVLLSTEQESRSSSLRSPRLHWIRRLHPSTFLIILLPTLLITSTIRENLPWQDSYSLWLNAARVRPESWAASYNAGLAALEKQKLSDALRLLTRAAELAPLEPQIFDALGRTYAQLGEPQKAEQCYKRAIEINPGLFESFNNLGDLYFEAGKYMLASQMFLKALSINDNAVVARYNLGLSYNRQGKYSDSARELETYINSRPTDINGYISLAEVYEKLGRIDDGIITLEKALPLSGSKLGAQEIRDRLVQLERSQSQKVNPLPQK